MPALNFKKEFAEKVRLGEKRQTIRAFRKSGGDPRPGQKLYHYTGQRTKKCKKLGEEVCESIGQIIIRDNSPIIIDGKLLSLSEEVALAKKDGFDSLDDFVSFFRKAHGLPFKGLLIKW